MYMFTMDAEATLIFFETVRDMEDWKGRKLTEEERVTILAEMAKMGYIKSVIETNRTKEEIYRDAVKNFGQILHLKEDGTAEILKPEEEDADDGY